MDCHPLENGVILLKFQSLRSVLPVLGGNVTGSARHTAVFVLSAFQDNLNPVAFYFLCHSSMNSFLLLRNDSDVFPIAITVSDCLLEGGIKTFLVNDSQAGSTEFEADPAILLYIEELLSEQVNIKCSLGSTL